MAEVFEALINPALGLLLYATFLEIPLSRLSRLSRLGADRQGGRFLGALLVVNFVLVPLLAFGLSRFVADSPGLLLGVLLVLLTPCIDYVIVFARLAGADHARLLALTPLLLVLQLVLLPGYLWLFAGPEAVAVVDPAPFVTAFLTLIALPLAAAALTQGLARGTGALAGPARGLMAGGQAAMVPLMVLVLVLVAASQAQRIADDAGPVLTLVPLYAVFAAGAAGLGLLTVRAARLGAGPGRAIVLSGVTRNSLVVLPLALALPEELGLASVAVVTQTLVELVLLVALVAVLPRLVPDTPPPGVGSGRA